MVRIVEHLPNTTALFNLYSVNRFRFSGFRSIPYNIIINSEYKSPFLSAKYKSATTEKKRGRYSCSLTLVLLSVSAATAAATEAEPRESEAEAPMEEAEVVEAEAPMEAKAKVVETTATKAKGLCLMGCY
jgi:hypothetical protein